MNEFSFFGCKGTKFLVVEKEKAVFSLPIQKLCVLLHPKLE